MKITPHDTSQRIDNKIDGFDQYLADLTMSAFGILRT